MRGCNLENAGTWRAGIFSWSRFPVVQAFSRYNLTKQKHNNEAACSSCAPVFAWWHTLTARRLAMAVMARREPCPHLILSYMALALGSQRIDNLGGYSYFHK
jgi:hypothetical protein